MNEWSVKDNRVFGMGKSFQCQNKITAKELCRLLNRYETAYQRNNNTERKFDRIQKSVIQLQLSCGIMQEELRKLHEEVI